MEGPSEFAEGLVIGVRSVFSGVVGGAAGTVSKITGAFGKGFAFLTFDEAFKRRRNEAIKKRGKQTLAESVARSSKGLAMGIFEGKRYWTKIGQWILDPSWAMDTGPDLGSGYVTRFGQSILDPNWAVDTGPELGSGYWVQIGQWKLDPNWAVDTGSNLGCGY